MKKFLYLFFVIILVLILGSCSKNNTVLIGDLKETPFIGDENALVTMVEFSEYQCPACKYYHENTFSTIKEKLLDTGRVKYKFIDFPLRSIHPYAQKASESTYCALEQGVYERYQDFLFKNQRSLEESVFLQGSEVLGLNKKKFQECLKSSKYKPIVDKNYDLSVSKGAQGTPTVVIGNIHVPNHNNFEEIEQFVSAFEKEGKEKNQALKEAFRKSLLNNLAMHFQRMAPGIGINFDNINIPEAILNDLVNRSGDIENDIIEMGPILQSLLENIINNFVGE